MTKEIKAYLAYLESLPKNSKLTEKEKNQILTRIHFYQHERLVHLMVTMTMAILVMMGFFFIMFSYENLNLPVLILFFLLLILLICYLCHYYFLENAIQKMYTLYYDK